MVENIRSYVRCSFGLVQLNFGLIQRLTDEQVTEIIFTKGINTKDTVFWSEISALLIEDSSSLWGMT